MRYQITLHSAFPLSLVFVCAQPSWADSHRRWNDSELSGKAKLIAIAEPVSKDRLLGPNDGSWRPKPVATEFRVLAIVRGGAGEETLAEGAESTLRHWGNPNNSNRVGRGS